MSRPLVDPRLLDRLKARFYTSACTIQESTVTQDAAGQPIPAWSNLDGHVGIACAVGDVAVRRIVGTDHTAIETANVIALCGYYPLITTEMQAIAGGRTWQILKVDYDAQATVTELTVAVKTL